MEHADPSVGVLLVPAGAPAEGFAGVRSEVGKRERHLESVRGTLDTETKTYDELVDGSAGSQEYIEDCQVCCRPINLRITVNEEGPTQVVVRREDE